MCNFEYMITSVFFFNKVKFLFGIFPLGNISNSFVIIFVTETDDGIVFPGHHRASYSRLIPSMLHTLNKGGIEASMPS